MDMQEWQYYVDKMLHCDYPIPPSLVADYNNWKCRSVVGRMLLLLKDIEGAMAVLATVRDVQPDMEDKPDTGLSEAEHKVLCLRDIGEIVWTLTGRSDVTISYLKEADRISRAYKYVFRSADRGAIWSRRLEIMRESGSEEEALEEARACLAKTQTTAGVDPYRFHAYKFIAESMASRGDYAKGALLLAEAYKFFPQSEAGDKDLKAAAAQGDPQKRYEAYHYCTKIQYRPWENDHVPTLSEVRELQYKNFLKRTARGDKEAERLINHIGCSCCHHMHQLEED